MDLEAKIRFKSIILRLAILLGAFGIYAAVSLLFSSVGVEILYLLLIPVALSGVLFGILGGLIGAVLGYLESEVLYRVAFPVFEDYTTALWILDFAITISLGVMTGYLSRINRRQKSLIERLKTTVHNKEMLFSATEESHAKIKELSGIRPICMYCRKIQDDEGRWHRLEVYVRDHSEMQFSHGICPECSKNESLDYIKENRTTNCPFTQICSFYNSPKDIQSHMILESLYCHMGFKKCQIYQLIDTNRDVPNNLLPDGAINSYGGSPKDKGR
jgi:hypothetical protein